MHSLLNTKKRKIGSSVGNLSATFTDILPSSSTLISRSQSLHSLKDISFSSSVVDWQTEKVKIDNALTEKAYVSFKRTEESSYELIENKLILECLKDMAKNNDKKLTIDTAKKLNTIIEKWETDKYLKLTPNAEDYNMQILGILNIPDAELSQMEKIRIKTCVETKLKEKIQQFLNIYSEEGFDLNEGLKHAENVRDRFLKKCGFEQYSLKGRIIELMENYQKSIVDCYEQLQLWRDLKNEMQCVQQKKAINLKLQAKIAEIQIKIQKVAHICKMYKETPMTLEAFQILNSMLDDRINIIDKEIQEKKELKKQYDAFKGSEFDTIVKEYNQLCVATDKYKKMLKEL